MWWSRGRQWQEEEASSLHLANPSRVPLPYLREQKHYIHLPHQAAGPPEESGGCRGHSPWPLAVAPLCGSLLLSLPGPQWGSCCCQP